MPRSGMIFRRLIMLSGIGLLAVGLWGGLVRLGLFALPVSTEIFVHHGAIMVGGFLGTLIGFERAVALDATWPFVTPVSCVIGTVWLLTGIEPYWGTLFVLVGSGGMVAVFGHITWKQPTDHAFLLTTAAICWVVGNGLWLFDWPIHRLVYWWMGFLVLTIVAERLELNRLMTIEGFKRWSYFLAFFGFIAGLLLRFWSTGIGSRVTGVSLVGLAVWLIVYDVARRTMWQGGEQGYSGWCMFLGYFWLIAGGVLLVTFPDQAAGYYYDAILHAVFVGFVFTMIFGHSLIIFPTVVGRSIPFSPWLYLPLVLLQGGLVVRVVGDLIHWGDARLWGGVINVIAIVLFFMSVAGLIVFSDDESDTTNRAKSPM